VFFSWRKLARTIRSQLTPIDTPNDARKMHEGAYFMLEQLLNLGRKIIPQPIFTFFQPAYHWSLACLANLYYGFPSKKLKIIGVTGTDGKTTTTILIASILEEAGFKVGMINGLEFKIGEKNWPNNLPLTMPGRFQLQKLLSQMAKEKCDYVILEVTSEGIIQYRILGINFMLAVLTNISPEHLDTHGTFENYRRAKGKLFTKLQSFEAANSRSISVINLDDKNAEYFLRLPAKEKWGYGIKSKVKSQKLKVKDQKLKIVEAENIEITEDHSSFEIQNSKFEIHLPGEYNVYNALAAVTVALTLGIDPGTIKEGLKKIKGIPGRMEEVKTNKGFRVFIDYAHTPQALEAVFKTARKISPEGKLIAVFGSAEGRDRIKRPLMGRVAAKLTDFTILTTDESLVRDEAERGRESPEEICQEIEKGFEGKRDRYKIIIDRRKAIAKALEIARSGDIVIIAGLGPGGVMYIGGEMRRWKDSEVVKELLEKTKI
jgi:UDP-N-acetylmuramoyl-L-alanyl-D-glutamate--2,6-diaminopimelate ligase